MNTTELCSWAIDEAKKLERADTEICADSVLETKIVFEHSDFSVASSSMITHLGIRSIVGSRQGFVTTNNLDQGALREKVRESQQIARLSPENPNYSIAELNFENGDYQMADERLVHAKPTHLLQWAEEFINQCLSDKRVSIDRAELSLTTSSRTISNSNGVNQCAKQTLASWFVMGMAKDGTEVTSFDYDGNHASTLETVRPKISQTANEFQESVLRSLGAGSGKSYKGLVLLHPSAVSDLIGGLISFNVNAKAQQDGMSKWKDYFGKEVAHISLNVFEDPSSKLRPATWNPFDREGVPTKLSPIISEGILRYVAHNSYTAKKAGKKPTGNAAGSARSVPAIGLHGLVVDSGNAEDRELFTGLGTGLLMKRFSGNADPISGQFSGIAKNSTWIQNGKADHALKEVMISGNMFDVIKNIRMIGKTQHTQSGTFVSPYILVDGISVTAG